MRFSLYMDTTLAVRTTISFSDSSRPSMSGTPPSLRDPRTAPTLARHASPASDRELDRREHSAVRAFWLLMNFPNGRSGSRPSLTCIFDAMAPAVMTRYVSSVWHFPVSANSLRPSICLEDTLRYLLPSSTDSSRRRYGRMVMLARVAARTPPRM